MPDPLILTETRGAVGLVTINRPEALNAISRKLLHGLMESLESFDREEGIGAIVITGNKKAFAAGVDIKELAGNSVAQMQASDFLPAFDRLGGIRKPVIAAVAGWALGLGLELALASDLVVAAENAKFGQPEITIGVIPGAGGTQRLTRAVGKALAMEMILNNRTLSAAEALQFGLVNRVVAADTYLDEAVKLAAEIAARPAVAIRTAKQMVNEAFEVPLSKGLSAEREAFYNLFASDDQKEGMRAFIEKRPPQWKGR